MMRKHVALFALIGLVVGAGCLDMTMTTEINEDGEIERMEYEMDMNEDLYTMHEQEAADQGYDDVESYLQANATEDFEGDPGDVEVTVEETDDGAIITMIATNIDPDTMEEVTVEVDGDTVRYEEAGSPAEDIEDEMDSNMADEVDVDESATNGDDVSGDESDEEFEEEFADMITMEYNLVMPGEITDHNADELSDDGTTATWNIDMSSEEVESFYAESTIGGTGASDDASDDASDEESDDASDEESDDESDDGLPGFGVGVAVAALLLSIAGLAQRGR